MSKKKKQFEIELEEKKPFIILNAKIKEAVCEYSYEINDGPCAGDQIKGRKGVNLVHEDLSSSFSKLNPHLAILDDAIDAKTISDYEDSEKYGLYNVSGFKVTGTEENEGFILIGEKWVKHGSISLESPKITKASAYPFFDDLCEAIERAREEVLAYMNGKSAPKYEQAEMDFAASETEDFNNPL